MFNVDMCIVYMNGAKIRVCLDNNTLFSIWMQAMNAFPFDFWFYERKKAKTTFLAFYLSSILYKAKKRMRRRQRKPNRDKAVLFYRFKKAETHEAWDTAHAWCCFHAKKSHFQSCTFLLSHLRCYQSQDQRFVPTNNFLSVACQKKK